MTYTRRLMLFVAAFCGLAIYPGAGLAEKVGGGTKLPAVVRRDFDAKFPKGEIHKVEAEEENGVTVYDVEFSEGTVEKETDIAADGTMLEYTIVIDTKTVPEAAM